LANPNCEVESIASSMRLGVETVQLYLRKLRKVVEGVLGGKKWGVSESTLQIFEKPPK